MHMCHEMQSAQFICRLHASNILHAIRMLEVLFAHFSYFAPYKVQFTFFVLSCHMSKAIHAFLGKVTKYAVQIAH
jgi:hypothetical protein